MTAKKTPLYEAHQKLGARIIDFGGFLMPVQYTGIIDETLAVRNRVGLFDVSHMGEFFIKGPDALAFVENLLVNDISKAEAGQVVYSPMCYPDGGVVDDLLCYRLGEEEFMLVVNAGNTEKDWAWINEHAGTYDVELKNRSKATGLVALQGPLACQVLGGLVEGVSLSELGYYHFHENAAVAGVGCLVSRTGYTGEDGFELYCPAGEVEKVWQAILANEEVVPCGLGARDILRLEARMPLYGHELSEEITPLQAGLKRFISFDKEFIGKGSLLKQKQDGLKQRIAGFVLRERGVPRVDYEVKVDGKTVGRVTSGVFSPTLEKSIGLALLDVEYAQKGQELEIVIRRKPVKARIIRGPFYKKGGNK